MENLGYREVSAKTFKKELEEEREKIRAKIYIDKAEEKITIESESNVLVMPLFNLLNKKTKTLMIGLRERDGLIKISKDIKSDHFWLFITKKEALNLMYQLNNILKIKT